MSVLCWKFLCSVGCLVCALLEIPVLCRAGVGAGLVAGLGAGVGAGVGADSGLAPVEVLRFSAPLRFLLGLLSFSLPPPKVAAVPRKLVQRSRKGKNPESRSRTSPCLRTKVRGGSLSALTRGNYIFVTYGVGQ